MKFKCECGNRFEIQNYIVGELCPNCKTDSFQVDLELYRKIETPEEAVKLLGKHVIYLGDDGLLYDTILESITEEDYVFEDWAEVRRNEAEFYVLKSKGTSS